ncbi:hypothetical protein QYE76_038536 [Lolium multiflorum]|uniref:N-acetyltransferase domain-containing protein n=2 Tax=Lolium multiflorum TaxID=4521 RepID=A0AAD8WTP2_LOLMU|nr:hypothetical protein QYE76_038536 [Lolium multiflorum]
MSPTAASPCRHRQQTRALARERRSLMMPEERSLPDNALDNPSWALRFKDERAVELARTANRSSGRFNTVDRRVWWYGRDADNTLRQYDFFHRVCGDRQRDPVYFPQTVCMASAPTLQRALKRTTAWRKLAHRIVVYCRAHAPAPPSGCVVIHDEARRTSSVPARRTTGSGGHPRVKEEDAAAWPPLSPVKKKWWEKEVEAHAALCGDDDDHDQELPALQLMASRSVDEDYRHITCPVCDSGEFEPAPDEFTDNTVICCDQCEREYHVSCIRSRGDQLECCPEGPWLCSQKCSDIFQRLQGLVGRPIPTSVEGLSFTLFRSSKLPGEEAMAAEEHGKLRMAFDVLHECFVTLIEPQTQSDLSHDIVFNRESCLRRLNFRGFYVVGIEKGGELITAGTLRVYGDKVAELPLVGTRFAHRRQGMCHLLMNNLEKLLGELGVERLVLPAVPELLQTWTESFGFQVMSQSDKLEIAEHTILCFQGTTMCHKFINKAVAPRR